MPSSAEMGLDPANLEKGDQLPDEVIGLNQERHWSSVESQPLIQVYQHPSDALLKGHEGQKLEKPIQNFLDSGAEYVYATNNQDETFRITRSELADESNIEVIRMRPAIVYYKPSRFMLPRQRKDAILAIEEWEQRMDSNYMLTHKLVLHDKTTAESVNIAESLPQSCKLYETGPECVDTNYFAVVQGEPTIYTRKVSELSALATLLHETGHAKAYEASQIKHADSINPKQAIAAEDTKQPANTKSKIAENKIKEERDAWAWALREARRLRDAGFGTSNRLVEDVHSMSEHYLATYDQGEDSHNTENYFASNMRFLKRRLESVGGVYEKLQQALDANNCTELTLNTIVDDDIITYVIHPSQLDNSLININVLKISSDHQPLQTHDKYTIKPGIIAHKELTSDDSGSELRILSWQSLDWLSKDQGYPADEQQFINKLHEAMEMADCIGLLKDIANYVSDQSYDS